MNIKRLFTTLLAKLIFNSFTLTSRQGSRVNEKIARPELVEGPWRFFSKGCLILAEHIYRSGFALTMAYKRWRAQPLPHYSFKVISVGNLAVGGTGKSVTVPFIVKLLGPQHCAVVLRGYGGSLARDGKAYMVSDGTKVFCTVEQVGDEAMMHATTLQVPVVVAHNRARACDLLEKYNHNQCIKYVILDDAYQHVTVRKDVEILLLDARYPIQNSHCLPRGLLREKDASRADIVIMTHADKAAEQRAALSNTHAFNEVFASTLEGITQQPVPIFYSRHKPVGIFLHNRERATVASAPLLLVAGVGSFAGVLRTAQELGLNIAATKQLSNHFAYTAHALEALCVAARNAGCAGIVTTHKDWVKIEPLYKPIQVAVHLAFIPIYVLRIELELL